MSAVIFNLTTVFVVLGLFWLIGAAAGALWWVTGVEARGLSVDRRVGHPPDRTPSSCAG